MFDDFLEIIGVPLACIAIALFPITFIIMIWRLHYLDNYYYNK